MLEELIQWDKAFFLYLNGLGTETWDGFWMYLSRTLSLVTIPIFLLLLVLSYRTFGLKRMIVLVITVTLLITCTDQLSNFFKYGFGRLRPCYDNEIIDLMRLVKGYCGGKFSFFSAHAANSFTLATFFVFLLKHKYRILVPFLLLWAFLVGYSRIYIGVHFPLDVLTGILVGFLFGWVFSKLYIFATLKIRA
ncbi:lipid A 4'-phosphatase [Croceitalea sp. MTPC5]|uniref:phosphatase PAP2 family protein n=1 Tax=Croceitalea sp. MTPC5 TaxID=3056565 RepID=UPI002B3ECF60|nr:lipid A 4'-phosphatase [Croceitalea sp. MTPC5]